MGGLANETAAVGAPTWWAAGYTGGSGSAPDGSASLAILNDKIQEDQPLFQGVGFERPSVRPAEPSMWTRQARAVSTARRLPVWPSPAGNSTCPALCDADTEPERGVAHGVKPTCSTRSFLGGSGCRISA